MRNEEISKNQFERFEPKLIFKFQRKLNYDA